MLSKQISLDTRDGMKRARACYGVLRFIMEAGAKGCEVIVSGKMRGARAKNMKFKDGFMITSGYPKVEYLDTAVRHVQMRQGTLSFQVAVVCSCDASPW